MEIRETDRVVLLKGTEPLLISTTIADILDKAGVSQEDSFDHSVVEAADLPVAAIVDAVQTTPFLSPRRSLVARRVNRLKKEECERLAELVGGVPDFGLLILTFEPVEEGDGERWTVLSKAIKPIGIVHDTNSDRERGGPKLLVDQATKAGVTLDSRIAEELIARVGGHLSEASLELEKLIAVADPGGQITRELMTELVPESAEWKIWNLLNGLLDGNVEEALKQYRSLVRGTSEIEKAFYRDILPLMRGQLRLIWQAVALREAGLRVESEEAKRFIPSKSSLTEVAKRRNYRYTRIMEMGRKATFDHLTRLMRILAEADLRSKGGLAGSDERETLERMIAELCEASRKRTAGARR